MVDKLKEIAETLGFTFNYGRGHWQNLLDPINDTQNTIDIVQVHCHLWWVDEQDLFNDFGAIEQTDYDAEFYVVAKSEITDEDYNSKYENRIKHLKDKARLIQDEFRNCSGFTLKYWKMIEVENQMDANMDGVKVTIKLSKQI